MNHRNAKQIYAQNTVNTAKPEELTLMLYNGILKFIRLSKKSISENDFQSANDYNLRAQKIVNELLITLNNDYDISKSLGSLYDYIYRQLIQANVKKDVGILDEVEKLSMELRDTWVETIKRKKQEASM